MNYTKTLCAIVVGVVTASLANAALFVYEDFDYFSSPSQNLHDQTGWSGSSDFTISGSSLGYTDLQGNVLNTSGGSAVDVTSGEGGSASFRFASQSNDFWMSFIYNGTTSSANTVQIDGATGDHLGVEEGATNDSIRFRTHSGGVGQPVVDITTVSRSTNVFYVIQFDFDPDPGNTEDLVRFWVNPGDMANLGAPTGTIENSGSVQPLFDSFSNFTYQCGRACDNRCP